MVDNYLQVDLIKGTEKKLTFADVSTNTRKGLIQEGLDGVYQLII